ncbi:MAG TPA: sigma factor-like helix-turn-helix DNA-binding protein [Planctomycetota bacterium]|nr:sigma factor-like helix-turn-helix DNA-binding protein [Planctomycetota bacterium]
MADASDAALVQARRFDEIVRRFDRPVRALVGRGVRDPHRRDEIVQQTFVLAFRRLGTLAAPERLKAWLLAIARNCVADDQRRRARRLVLPPRDRPAPEAPPGWIWEEVATLSAALAEVLRLRYREGLGLDEIAARVGVPASTVRGRIYTARRTLRRRLKEE